MDEFLACGDLSSYADYMKGNRPTGAFKIEPYYIEELDEISLYLEDVASYGEYISPEVEIMRACDDSRVVGVEIAGIRRLIGDNYVLPKSDEVKIIGKENE